jgi:hypothetical protein
MALARHMMQRPFEQIDILFAPVIALDRIVAILAHRMVILILLARKGWIAETRASGCDQDQRQA